MTREKDAQLAASCQAMAQVTSRALDWFADNEKLVGNRLPGLQRAFKRHTVEARKLALAAERPMSVGVFGASQAGKSFLIGRLITPTDNSAKVVFGEGDEATKLDFLTEVNPQGGKETTGLVTRFSIAPKQTPPGFAVALRLLREVDVIKILANSFVFDLGAQADEGYAAASERFAQLQEQLADKAQARPVDAMGSEDIYELREYIEQILRRHPLASESAAAYWTMAEELAPLLSASDRAELFAIIWGGISEFSELYLQLKQALDQLNHSEWGYVSLDAIRDRAQGILHVDTLMGLDKGDSHVVTVAIDNGAAATLPKPVVTALTAELRVTLDIAPWAFFEHTDLLDFPGARSRADNKKVLRDTSDPDKPPRAYCFLRGKVAVLFDNYVADLDLNTMLLCVGPENQEVAKLPELVEGWIAKTHGGVPAERQNKRTSIFFCMTKTDFLFRLAAGATQDLMINNRMDNNLRFFPGWTGEWTPATPFNNCYLIRNPKAGKQEEIFEYAADTDGADVPDETGLRADKAAWLDDYCAVFAGNDIVKRHVAEPAQRWQAMLTLNDGGVSYLADRLAPVCDPDLKYDQVQPRAQELRDKLLMELHNYYESGDLARRVEERVSQMTNVIKKLSQNPGLIGVMLSELQTNEISLGQRFLEESRRISHQRSDSASATTGTRGIILDLADIDTDQEAQQDAATAAATGFGDAAIRCWLEDLERKGGEEAFCKTFNLTTEDFLSIVNELAIAARRCRLSDDIDDFVRKAEAFNQRKDEVVHRVAMGTALIINTLVNRLATDLADGDAVSPVQFQQAATLNVGDQPQLPADAGDMQRIRGQYLSTWLQALRELARQNASWGQGGLVDVEQNQRLGNIIEMIKA